MNMLAGWGFATPEAFARHADPSAAPAPEPKRRPVVAKGRYVSQRELAAWATTLQRVPTHAEVWAHFQCSRTAAYNYLRKVVLLLARRASGRDPAPNVRHSGDAHALEAEGAQG